MVKLKLIESPVDIDMDSEVEKLITKTTRSKFTHLHVHSDGSNIDGLGPVSRLVKGAKSLGFDSLGLTDHGSLKNVISFTAACNDVGIKPIIGLEAYVIYKDERYHLTLLANGNTGFKTLTDLNNAGVMLSPNSRPAFPLDLLEKYNDNLICLSGCPNSPMQTGTLEDAYEIAGNLKRIFKDNFYAEVMFIGTYETASRASKLIEKFDLKPIVTNDAHFPYKTDYKSHSVLTKLKANFEYDSKHLFLATPNELRVRVDGLYREYLPLLEEGMENAYQLAQEIESVVFDDTPKLPVIEDADEKLKSLTLDGLDILIKTTIAASESLSGEYFNRMDDELAVISDMNFSSYFLILHDIITYAKSADVWIGPGRGSGAGSLVLYLLGITEIDPIKYNLYFDRFLNRKRAEMPDVDVDFEADRRGLVIDYAIKRWGAVAVATYSRWSHKSLTHDLGRIFQLPRTTHQAAADAGLDSPEFRSIETKYGSDFRDAYDAMLGQIRHTGRHAGGVVIVPEGEPIPLEKTSGGDVVAGWTEGEYRELSLAGIVKFDLLGLSAGTVLRRLEEQHDTHAPQPTDDSPVFELFQSGETLGIFQFSGSQGIIDFTKKIAPHKFEDLIAINALYRPGTLSSGVAQKYPAWRLKPRLLHPVVDDVLAETYGIICYQEQLMMIVARILGIDFADADIARKVFTKARPGQIDWERKIAKLKVDFFEGCEEFAIDTETSEKIWFEITTHAGYSFNKAHATAYAMISWEMAWWKYYHPVDFYAAMLTSDKSKWEEYLFSVLFKGIEIVPPTINKSTDNFESDGSKIYLPLSVVKFLGDTGIKKVIEARPFTSCADFIARVPKRAVTARSRLGLYMLGAFDEFEDANPEVLGIKVPEEEVSASEAQEKYMGLYLPTPDVIRAIEIAWDSGWLAGVVSYKDVRMSKNYGPYTSYRMMPSGAFWSRTYTDIKIGDKIRVKRKADNGRAIKVESLV